MRAKCFRENGRFFEKNKDMRATCFLENGRFFTNHGHESSDFSVKNRKKGYPIDFFSP